MTQHVWPSRGVSTLHADIRDELDKHVETAFDDGGFEGPAIFLHNTQRWAELVGGLVAIAERYGADAG